MPYRLTLCLTGLDVVGQVIGSDSFFAFPVVKYSLNMHAVLPSISQQCVAIVLRGEPSE